MKLNVPTPQEIDELMQEILADVRQTSIPPSDLGKLVEEIEKFLSQWSKIFDQFGLHLQGELAYQDLILGFREQITPMVSKWLSAKSKGKIALKQISSVLSTPQKPLMGQLKVGLRAKRKENQTAIGEENFTAPEFDRPLFIVSAPRAGSTLLFETLSQFADLWTIGIESHEIIEGIPELHPRSHDFSSNRLTQEDAVPNICAELRQRFTKQLRDRDECIYLKLPEAQRPQKIRFLEKTPKNALRIPFLKAAFPGAKFIYLYREPKANISSIIEGWRSRRFVSYRNLPGWAFREWSFFLPIGYTSLQDCSLAEIAAYQWKTANVCILDDLQSLPSSSWCLVNYEDLVGAPEPVIRKLAQFAELDWEPQITQLVSQKLPVSSMSFSAPSPNKWQKNAEEIIRLLPNLASITKVVENMPC
ncbi:MAG: sulfotransferase [Symploca sp. SIO3E6]|nr:sulfotransferase [Caldora sp. SIO3E6]